MRFGLIFEGNMPPDREETESRIFWQAIEQAVQAEKYGFEFQWAVEHHFLEGFSHCSAPEIFLASVAQHTETMRIGHGVCLLPYKFNHPIRAAERAATLDILSNGRLEFGTGRALTIAELEGFGIHPDDTRDMWDESMHIIPRMWTEHEFQGHKGKFLDIPKRVVVPKPVQDPHPPVWLACTSPTSYLRAGEYGLGALCLSFGKPADVGERLKTYHDARASMTQPLVSQVNDQIAAFSVLHCAADDETARQRGGKEAIGYLGQIAEYVGDVGMYDGYREWAEARGRDDKGQRKDRGSEQDQIDKMIQDAGLCLGDPDRCCEVIQGYADAGVDQFLGIVQYGNLEHDEIMEGIRLFGENVIPKFR